MSVSNLRFYQVTAADAWGMNTLKRLAMLALPLVLWAVSQQVLAQQEEVIDSGRQIFQRSCAICHGPEGKGDGRLGPHLKETPADLGHISREHGGTFPFWLIYGKIDGREEVSAHGSREMPVWGTNQVTDTASGQLGMGQILALVFFLESIQTE